MDFDVARLRERLSVDGWVRAFAAASVVAALLVVRGPWTALGYPNALYILQLLLATLVLFGASNYANMLRLRAQRSCV